MWLTKSCNATHPSPIEKKHVNGQHNLSTTTKKTKILQKERKQASNLESIDVRATPSVCAEYVTLQIKVK
jgi:hypothetical protein